MIKNSLRWFAAACLVATVARAQIPNPGFENWTGGNPDGWQTTNSPPTFVNVTQVAGRTGSAAQGAIINFSGFAIPVSLLTGYSNATRPAALHGWYKFTSVSGDALNITIAFEKNGSGIGGGVFTTTASQGTFREFVANILWSVPDNPDTADIGVSIVNSPSAHAGSTFVLDDLAYGPASDVRENDATLPQMFALSQNYPNPFNPTTRIRYELPKASHVTLKVFNMLGQEVASLVEGERSAGSYIADFNAANLPSGAYIYRLQAGDFTRAKTLMLLK